MLRSTRSKRIAEGYLEFLRGKTCLFCGAFPAEPHHLIARGWREPFRDDYVTVPACRSCHEEGHALPLPDLLARHGMTEKEGVVAVVDLLVEYFIGRRAENGSEEDLRRRLVKTALRRSDAATRGETRRWK